MERVRELIQKNLEAHPHFAEYFKIIGIIEAHEPINPDICIESCKALIEGVSKTIIVTLDDSVTVEDIDKFDIPKLFKIAVKVLVDRCEDLEGDYISRYGQMINELAFIRNRRGDISHGRVAPKPVYSSKKFATTVRSVSEAMLDYMLTHYFDLDFKEVRKLNYFKKPSFNEWLDGTVEDFPIKTSSYSFLLYENDYGSYEYLHRNDYQLFLELEQEEAGEPIGGPETPPLEPIGEPDVKLPEPVGDPEALPLEPVGPLETGPASPPTPEGVPDGNIVPWTDEQEAALVALVDDMKLKLPFARRVVQQYLFDGRSPLAEQIVETLPEKPKLKERRAIVEAKTSRLVALAEQLKPAPEEEQ